MTRFAVTFIALLVVTAAASHAAEMQLSLQGEQPRILLTGRIEAGDGGKLRALIDRAMIGRDPVEGTGLVAFNSDGGNFLEGMEIGMVLQKAGWGTRVLRSHSCLSTCALAFLGGTSHSYTANWATNRTLEAGATLGFHAFFSTSNEPISTRVGTDAGRNAANLLYAYFSRLGIEPTFAIAALRRGPQDLLIANTPEMLKALRVAVVGLPAGFSSRMTPVGAVSVCTNITGWSPGEWTGTPKAEEITSDQFRRQLLKRLLAPLGNIARHKPGPITAAIVKGLSATDSEVVRLAYSEAHDFDLVPWDPEGNRILMINGLEHVRAFKSRACYVIVARDGQSNMSARVVLTPIDDGIGRYEEVSLSRYGDVFYEMLRPNERLW